jgi:hypothetical protein
MVVKLRKHESYTYDGLPQLIIVIRPQNDIMLEI